MGRCCRPAVIRKSGDQVIRRPLSWWCRLHCRATVGAWYAEGGYLDPGLHISKFLPLVSRTIVTVAAVACLTAFSQQLWAAAEPSIGPITGRVVDQLDAAVSATVVLVQEGSAVAEVQSDESGRFVFQGVASGRFWIEAYAAGFARARSASFYAGSSEIRPVTVVLSVGPITQHVVVTASASELPEAQSGSPVSILTRDELGRLAVELPWIVRFIEVHEAIAIGSPRWGRAERKEHRGC